MSALAAYLRERTAAETEGLSTEERLALALTIGDDDLNLFCLSTGLTAEDARARVRASRRHGRRASRVANT